MRQIFALVSAIGLLMMLGAGAAVAHPHDWDDVTYMDPHPHALLIGADFTVNLPPEEGEPPILVHGYERCVDLAAGQTLPTAAQHNLVHQGQPGQHALLSNAGHLVVPYSCGELPIVNGD